jgi:hypothetical protein
MGKNQKFIILSNFFCSETKTSYTFGAGYTFGEGRPYRVEKFTLQTTISQNKFPIK